MTSAAIEFKHATVRHHAGGAPAIHDVSFRVNEGERVALVGANGSGKTTLLLSAVGLLEHEGEIEVCGFRLTPATLSLVRSKVGFVFNVPEDQLLFPHVIEDVAFSLHRAGVPGRTSSEAALRLLRELGIDDLAREPVHHLSHGQKQLVALAGALVAEPPLLLLDEPSSGLDPLGRRHLAKLLQRDGTAVLLATHDLEFAERVCSRFVMLDHGRLVERVSSGSDILARWGGD
ncbi:MAG TPA: ABC transporter ATP-binding protein [Gemmatimonadales bacterium]|nr:ABC transporter ATP-binding protein [Anaeromyxobacteraceae bacterium]HTS88823.1 ABC transporter ATP-binding protein [Gemmatimonadales bacterium]